jgi:hypothetical protein
MNAGRRARSFPTASPVVSVHVERLVVHDAGGGLRHEELERSIRLALVDLLGTPDGGAAAPGSPEGGAHGPGGVAGSIGRAVAPAVASAAGLPGLPASGSRP